MGRNCHAAIRRLFMFPGCLVDGKVLAREIRKIWTKDVKLWKPIFHHAKPEQSDDRLQVNDATPSPDSPDAAHAAMSSSEVDEKLVARVQGGDSGAFDLLVEKYKKRLYSVIYNMLANRDDAADLSQEVFVKAFKSITTFRGKSSFYVWLHQIGVNTALNFIKQRKDNTLSLNVLQDEYSQNTETEELMTKQDVRQDVDREELQEKLNEALQKLSEEHRAVVVLHDIEGMKHQELAKVLGCSEATARSRLFYAHQELQGLLAKYL